MPPVLRLCEDVLADGAALSLPARPRLAFVVHGSIAAGDRVLRDGEAWSGEDAATFKAGGEGATTGYKIRQPLELLAPDRGVDV